MTGAIGTIDKPYNWKYTPLVLVGIFIIFYGSFSVYYYILKRNGIYSIAVVTGFKNIGAKGDECTSFYFYYKGTKYEHCGYSDNYIGRNDIGKYYFVRFIKEHPNRCELLYKSPVPDCITEAPPEGWMIIPKCLSNDGK